MAVQIGAYAVSLTAIEASGEIALDASIYFAVGTAIVVGANYGLQAALAPGAPSPSHQKQVINQAIGPRIRFYGENKVGGTRAFLDARNSNLYQLIMLNSGEIDSFVSHWLGDEQLTLDGSGIATAPAIYTDKDYVTIKTALGTDDQVANAMLVAAYPGEWTTDHRLRGIAYSVVKLLSPPAKDFSKIYPASLPPYNAVIRAAKVWDPRDEAHDPDDKTTWTWTQNGYLVLLDYLWHAQGMRLPRAMLDLGIDVWKDAANFADEAVALKAGGTEPRLRLSGGYPLNAPPKQALPSMLVPLDARLLLRADGAIVPDIGRYVAPTITLTDAHIIDYSGMARAREAADVRNKITANFVSAAYNFVEQEADAWLVQDSIDLEGEQPLSLDLTWVPSHPQARRRMKPEAYRQNPDWFGTIVTNAHGLRVILGDDDEIKRFVQIQIAELGIDGSFEILSWKFDVLSGNCAFEISAMPAVAYAWDAATEEGTAPGADASPASVDVEDVEGLAVSVEGADSAFVLVATWDAPVQDGLGAEAAWRTHDGGVSDDDAVWSDMAVSGEMARGGPFVSGTYDVRVRFTSPSGGVPGDYDFARSVTVGTVAPSAPTATTTPVSE